MSEPRFPDLTVRTRDGVATQVRSELAPLFDTLRDIYTSTGEAEMPLPEVDAPTFRLMLARADSQLRGEQDTLPDSLEMLGALLRAADYLGYRSFEIAAYRRPFVPRGQRPRKLVGAFSRLPLDEIERQIAALGPEFYWDVGALKSTGCDPIVLVKLARATMNVSDLQAPPEDLERLLLSRVAPSEESLRNSVRNQFAPSASAIRHFDAQLPRSQWISPALLAEHGLVSALRRLDWDQEHTDVTDKVLPPSPRGDLVEILIAELNRPQSRPEVLSFLADINRLETWPPGHAREWRQRLSDALRDIVESEGGVNLTFDSPTEARYLQALCSAVLNHNYDVLSWWLGTSGLASTDE
jgi:hypothetical protein